MSIRHRAKPAHGRRARAKATKPRQRGRRRPQLYQGKTWSLETQRWIEQTRREWGVDPDLQRYLAKRGLDPHTSPLTAALWPEFDIAAYPIGFAFRFGKGWGFVAHVDFKKNTVYLRGVEPAANPEIADLIIAMAQIPEFAKLKVEGDNVEYSSVARAARDVHEVEHGATVHVRDDDKSDFRVFRYRVLKTLTDYRWFHATRVSKLRSIRKRGLLTSITMRREQGQTGWTEYNLHLQDAAYLTNDIDYAQQIAVTLAQRYGEAGVVLEVTMRLNPEKTIVDEDALRDDYDGMVNHWYDPRWPPFMSSLMSRYRSIGYGEAIPASKLAVVGRVTRPEFEEVIDWMTREPTGKYEHVGGLDWQPAKGPRSFK